MNKYRESVEYYLYNRQIVKESKVLDDQRWSTIIEGMFKKHEGTEVGKLMQLKYVQKLPRTKHLRTPQCREDHLLCLEKSLGQ